MTSGTRPSASAISDRARCVVSSVVPSGKSTTIWNSFLLSNGSILTITTPSGTRAIAATSSTAMTPKKTARARPPFSLTSGVIARR